MPAARRLGNDQVRHDVNRRGRAVAATLGPGDVTALHFLCECNRVDCGARIVVSVGQFRRLDGDNRFLVVPEHYTGPRGRITATAAGAVYAIRPD